SAECRDGARWLRSCSRSPSCPAAPAHDVPRILPDTSLRGKRHDAAMARTSPADRAVVAHELLDAGQGRRLDRFGSIVVDRPFPGVERLQKRDPAAWRAADARFERAAEGPLVHAGWTTADGGPIEPCTIDAEGLTFELRLSASGQVGYFPEQAANRASLRERIQRTIDPPAILNLFAYTGASTPVAA